MRAHGLQHIHKRKRAGKEQTLYTYPSKNPFIKKLDAFLIIVAVFAPFIGAAQIIEIITEQTSKGVSIPMWIMYTIVAVPWLVYGIAHKEKPIIITYSLIIMIHIAIVATALAYP